MMIRVLRERTGEDLDTWNQKIQRQAPGDSKALERWLDGVWPGRGSGAQDIRSLVTPKRTFARIQPTTMNRVDLGLRLEGVRLDGRLQPSTIHETMQVQIGISSVEEVDLEVLSLLEKAHAQNSE